MTLQYYWLLWLRIAHCIFAPKNMSMIALMGFETCVLCSKVGGVGIDDVNCQTVTGVQKCCTKPLQSLFSLINGAHKATRVRLRACISRSFLRFLRKRETACSQSIKFLSLAFIRHHCYTFPSHVHFPLFVSVCILSLDHFDVT